MESSRFKNDEDREWHTRIQFEAQRSYDEARRDRIEKEFGLKTEILSQNILRVTDGVKRLDLYKDRYFKVDTGERGDLKIRNEERLIREYFGI